MSEEDFGVAVTPHDETEANEIERVTEIDSVSNEIIEQTQTMVPLSALQKTREKKRELELELQWERQERQKLMDAQKPTQQINDNDDEYTSATQKDLKISQGEIVRLVEENHWIKNNPEKYELVIENLPEFLKQRPNLRRAIDDVTNRYEEAYNLMNALTPKQQDKLKKDSISQASKKGNSPNSPNSVPRSAVLNDALDVMDMSDSEFVAWRKSKRKR